MAPCAALYLKHPMLQPPVLHRTCSHPCCTACLAAYAAVHPEPPQLAHFRLRMTVARHPLATLLASSVPVHPFPGLIFFWVIIVAVFLPSCRQPSKASINAVRIKPSNAQNSSCQEQGEPPTKKLKANQLDTAEAAGSQSTLPPAAAPQAPASLPAVKSQLDAKVEAPKATLTAMLGEHLVQTPSCLS